jgi:hypothetical protein
MTISVEFFGLARQRAGIGQLQLDFPGARVSLREVLSELAARLPSFAACVHAGRLDTTLAANLDGNCFVIDPETTIEDGQSLLLLSADAGG